MEIFILSRSIKPDTTAEYSFASKESKCELSPGDQSAYYILIYF